MSAPWPPPPDLESVQQLVREADVERLIEVHGAPADEYEPEGRAMFAAIQDLPPSELTAPRLLTTLEGIWRKNFVNDEDELFIRRPALQRLAAEIARFFGPEATPAVR